MNTELLNPFTLGEFVHFPKGYTSNSRDKTPAVGKITTLLSRHCGVTPVGGKKELFFYYEELTRPESNHNEHQPLQQQEKEGAYEQHPTIG